MKILHLLTSGGIGGIETLCKDYARLSEHENIFTFLQNPDPIGTEMASGGARVVIVCGNKKNLPRAFKTYIRLCKQEKVEAVVVHHASPILHLALLLIKLHCLRVKTIAYAHANAADMCNNQRITPFNLRKYLVRASFRKADKILAISKSVQQSLVELFCISPSKIVLLYNGVNTGRFQSVLRVPQRVPHIIFVGRLVDVKGVQVLLCALSKLPPNLSFHCLIVGDGTYRADLEQLCAELTLKDRVDFLGSRRDVPALLINSDIFVHVPIWEEGFGLTVVEAMAAGLISIGSRSGALPEIIEDGKNGYLVPKGDADALATRIADLLSDLNAPHLINLREQARATAQVFSIETFAQNLDRALEQ